MKVPSFFFQQLKRKFNTKMDYLSLSKKSRINKNNFMARIIRCHACFCILTPKEPSVLEQSCATLNTKKIKRTKKKLKIIVSHRKYNYYVENLTNSIWTSGEKIMESLVIFGQSKIIWKKKLT